MGKIWLLGNPYDRFHSELGVVSDGITRPPCDVCGYPLGEPRGFDCFWDTGLGAPDRAIGDWHDVFWCEFAMLAAAASVDRVKEADMAVRVVPARCMAGDEAATRFGIPKKDFALELAWLEPLQAIDVSDVRFPTCRQCGKFADEAWRLTRLEVRRGVLPEHGIFRLNQNRGFPSFITDEGKTSLLRTGLRGIGFHPAGRVVP